MKRSFLSFALASVGVVCFALISAGCHKDDADSAAPGKPGAPMNRAQTAQAVNDNPNMSPQLKAQVGAQLQSPSGRPVGAPAAPQAH